MSLKSMGVRRLVLPVAAMLSAGLLLPLPIRAQSRSYATQTQWLVVPLAPAEVARLERQLESDPEDIAARIRLLYAYVASPNNARRATHLLWLIEHHPQNPELATPVFLHREPGPLQDVAAYDKAAELWERQAARYPEDRQVILNAAAFLRQYYYLTNPFQAEQWTLRASRMDSADRQWRDQLAMDYAFALVHVASGKATNTGIDFARHVRAELERSTEPALLWRIGDQLLRVSQSPVTPETTELQEYARRLVERSTDLGFHPPAELAGR
jgi:hypothetical protein